MRFVIVIAPDHNWFNNWCLIENDPPLNPRDPRWVVVTNAEETCKLFWLVKELTDIQYLGDPWTSKDRSEIYSALIRLKMWHPRTGAINIWNPTPAEFATFWIKSP